MLMNLLSRRSGGYGRIIRNSGLVYQQRMCSTMNVNKDTEAIAGTMNNVKIESNRLFGIQKTYSVLKQSREHLLRYQPKTVDELPARTMQDSFTSAVIPLSTDFELQDKYVTFLGSVRLGRLMEDMDQFAVWVVQQHVKIPNLDPSIPMPYTFVTLLVDRISFTDIIPKNDQDIRLSGHVSWVGRSTAEVVVWLEQKQWGKWRKLTRALFLMASRNAVNTEAAIINPLKPATEEEQQIYAGGELRKKRRMQLQKESIFSQEPNDYEQKLIHNMFSKTINLNNKTFNARHLPADAVWMENAIMLNNIFSHPEDRNAHNTVFGGFLMRHALEISWALGHQFTKCRPKLEHISDISFHRPVPVSSLIKMNAHIIYTDMNYMEIVVVTDASDSTSGDHNTTNVFYFTYSTIEKIPRIMPRTYHEAMWYLDGRRKFNAAMGLDGAPPEVQFPILTGKVPNRIR